MSTPACADCITLLTHDFEDIAMNMTARYRLVDTATCVDAVLTPDEIAAYLTDTYPDRRRIEMDARNITIRLRSGRLDMAQRLAYIYLPASITITAAPAPELQVAA